MGRCRALLMGEALPPVSDQLESGSLITATMPPMAHGTVVSPDVQAAQGSKPRVVNAPALFSPADEISTGLDSTTTYQIVRCMRNVAHLQEVRRSSVIATCRYLSLCTLAALMIC